MHAPDAAVIAHEAVVALQHDRGFGAELLHLRTSDAHAQLRGGDQAQVLVDFLVGQVLQRRFEDVRRRGAAGRQAPLGTRVALESELGLRPGEGELAGSAHVVPRGAVTAQHTPLVLDIGLVDELD